MTRTKTVALAAALLCLQPISAVGEYRPERIRWSELDYEAHKLGFSIEAQLSLRKLDSAALGLALADPAPGRWLTAPAAGGWQLGLTSAGLGKRSQLTLLIDQEGRALQRTQMETGRRLKDYYHRTQRFGVGAVHIRTLKPRAGEESSPPTDWSDLDDWVPELPEGVRPGQSTGLFYTLAAADLDRPGDRVTTWVYAKDRVSRVDLEVEAREPLEVDFVEVAGASERRRRESIPALRIRVSGTPLDEDDPDASFRFLGLRGTVYVFLDEATRAPLLITGRISWLGRAQVKLERLVLGDA
jgi:hypothetical protein